MSIRVTVVNVTDGVGKEDKGPPGGVPPGEMRLQYGEDWDMVLQEGEYLVVCVDPCRVLFTQMGGVPNHQDIIEIVGVKTGWVAGVETR